MIGEPMPDPRHSIIDNLNQQLEAFFGSGKKAQLIPNGVGVDGPYNGTTAHHERLRKERDKLHLPYAPKQPRVSWPALQQRT